MRKLIYLVALLATLAPNARAGIVIPAGGGPLMATFDFIGTPGASQKEAFTCVYPVTVPTNFLLPTSQVTCGSNPSEQDIYTVKINGATVGTITLSTSCGVTLGTATATTCAIGQRFEIDAPGTVSGSDIAFGIGISR